MTVTLTKENVSMALDHAIEKRGEKFVYSDKFGDDYVYVDHKGEPRCIVGEVLIELGVPASAFEGNYMSQGAYHPVFVNTTKFGSLVDGHRLPIEGDEGVIRALVAAQNRQDHGQSWGQARQVAREYLELVSA